jgi:LysR family pca operon transcriptional activator
VVSNDIEEATLRTLPIETSDTKGPVGLTMRTDMVAQPAFAILLRTIREAAGKLG